MRKIYSLVLMVTALLIGTNAWATVNEESVADGDAFEDVWNELMLPGTTGKTTDSLKIQLEEDITLTKKHWIGTRTMNSDTLLYVEIDLNGHDLNLNGNFYGFVLTHGTLKITNSSPIEGKGKINHSNTDTETFWVAGSTKKDVDPSKTVKENNGKPYFSHLVIGKDVTVNRLGKTPQTENGYKKAVIAIEVIYSGSNGIYTFGGCNVNYKNNVF